LCLIETAKQDLKENRAHQKKEVFLCFLYWKKKGNRKGTVDLLGESLGNASAFWCVMTTFAHWSVRPLDVSACGNLLINIRTVNSRAGAKKNSSSSSYSFSSFCSSHSLQRYAKFGSSSASRCSKLHRVGVRSFGQEQQQQQQQKHRSSEEEVVMAVAMAGCAAAAAHAAPLKLEKVVLTKEHLSLARAEMDKFIEPIQQHPDKREGALPYYLLHKEGEHVYGTVLMFHGFAASTGQMARLAQYLFENGFNVYQPALCGHYYNAKYWPKVDLKPKMKEAIQQKLKADPELSAIINSFKTITELTTEMVMFLNRKEKLDYLRILLY
jgi:hypothetical protein